MKTSLIALSAGLAAGLTAGLTATPALAAEESDLLERDTIIVTGELGLEARPDVGSRLGLSIRETPATIDVVTQEEFRLEGIRTAIEAMNAAPGVQAGNLPGSVGSVSMRGFHRAINYLYDGVRMANSDVGVRNWDSWSFERIEVIKGPASVTSGEGALAGAINFVPRRPRLDKTSAELLASYGSWESARLAGDINQPLGRAVAVRANAAYSRSSGWVEDADAKTFAGALSVLAKPGDRLSVTLSADYFEDRFSTAYYGTPVVSRAVARDPSDAVSGSAGLVLDKAMRTLNFNVADGHMGSDSLWLRARAEYELSGAWKIVSDTSWYEADRTWRDADEFSFNAATGLVDRGASYITHDHSFWNQRVHLAGDGAIAGHRNRFTIGLEAGETDFFTRRRFGSAGGVDPFQPERGVFPVETPETFSTRQDVKAQVRSLAFFAENAFNLTPEWLVLGGLRYDDIKLDRHVENVTSGAISTYGQSYDPLSWRLGTVYSLRPQTQLYAQYTRAVTPVSSLLFMSAANAAFKLTTGKSFEGGIKTSLAGGRVQLAAAGFHIRQNDILTRDPANPAIVLQGGVQKSTGGEVSLDWQATDALSIAVSGTLLNARLDKLIEAGGADRSGNRPPNVAEKLADVVVTYAPKALPIRLTGIVRHNGGFYTSNANTVKVKGHTTVDAVVSWQAPFGTLAVRGRNLTDAFYADWSGYASGLVFVGAPRSVEVSLTTGF